MKYAAVLVIGAALIAGNASAADYNKARSSVKSHVMSAYQAYRLGMSRKNRRILRKDPDNIILPMGKNGAYPLPGTAADLRCEKAMRWTIIKTKYKIHVKESEWRSVFIDCAV